MSSGNIKPQSHDVRRQLFLGITKKMKNSIGSRRDDASSPSSDQQEQAHFLQPSTSHTVPKSPRSKRISHHALTPRSTFNSNTGSGMSLEPSSERLRPPAFVKSDEQPAMTKFILHKKEDINDYDYHTFSSKHSLRVSKVKALEQAEVTTSLYFNFEANDGVEEALTEDEQNEVLICLPGQDRASTKIEIEQLQHKFQQMRGL